MEETHMDHTFLIDENLSPAVVELFRSREQKAYHINELKAHPKHRVTDDRIRRLLMDRPDLILVTKDDDFVKSYVDRKVPERMIYVFELEDKMQMVVRLGECLDELLTLMTQYDFVEVNSKNIRTPFGPSEE